MGAYGGDSGVVLGALLFELAAAFDVVFDDGAGFGGLPVSVGGAVVDGPFDVEVDAGFGVGGVAEEVEGGFGDQALHRAVVRHAEGVAEGEGDADDAGEAEAFGEERHRGDGDGGDAGFFDGACQHGHVSTAVWSRGGEDEGADAGVLEALSDLGSLIAAPVGEVAVLESHE